MSVFEDLIDELKNENLLENTVIDSKRADVAAPQDPAKPQPQESAKAEAPVRQEAIAKPPVAEPDIVVSTSGDETPDHDLPRIEKPASKGEFFRKRAMDEVSSLQMVEHVLSGVEREHMKISPVSFDDLSAKKALHRFMQISDDVRSPEHAEAELDLRQETEAWSYAMSERDQKISVANLRRFCEESRPVLSSQALIALARFYRNSPYSENVRGKFDYVMTRLFSRETEEGTRRLLFPHAEMIGHMNTLYGNWSSIALYTQEDDQIEVSLTITRFDEFRVEAESAEKFDELLQADFFNRVRVYKEESAEMFYVPEVVAAAIKCNLAIGNRFIELMGREKSRLSIERIAEKYADVDSVVSNVAGRSMVLSDVLEMEIGEPETAEAETAIPATSATSPKAKSESPKPRVTKRKVENDSGFDFFGVNKWLMIVCAVFLLLGVSAYMWGEKLAGGDEGANTVTAKPLKIDDSEINLYVRSPRYTSETFYAVTEPAFDTLGEEKQKELLGKIQKFAATQNLHKVSLLNREGRAVAYASPTRLEIVHQ